MKTILFIAISLFYILPTPLSWSQELTFEAHALTKELNHIGRGFGFYVIENGFAAQSMDDLIFSNTTKLKSKKHPIYGEYELTFGDIASSGVPPVLNDSEYLGAWVVLTEVPCKIAKEIDVLSVDGTLNAEDGSLRYSPECEKATTLYYLLARVKE